MRLAKAKSIETIGLYMSIFLGVSTFWVLTGIVGQQTDSAVWYLAIDVVTLIIGAIASLFMGWSTNASKEANEPRNEP